jgi:hypothetical protein
MLADLVFVVAAVAVLALLAAWVIFFLNDLTYAERVRFLPRWLWAVLCLITIPLGGIAYLLIGRVWKRARPPEARHG